MAEIAYAVRSDDEFTGYEAGVLALPVGTFHLGEALKDGHGYVVVHDTDTALVVRLDEQVALERVDVTRATRAARVAKPETAAAHTAAVGKSKTGE